MRITRASSAPTFTDQFTELLVRYDPPEIMRTAGMDPDPWQANLLDRQPHRAMVVCSRQAGKSTVCAATALHRAVSAPRRTIVVIAPTQRQSTLLVSKIRDLAGALRIDLTRSAATSLEFANGSVVYGLPGAPATVRGYSPHLLILDEAAYMHDELYEASLPMLTATQGDLVAISTPNGQQGWFWREWNGDGAPGWSRVEVPYSEIDRISRDFIAEQQASMSAARFAAEYECAFNTTTSSLFPGADLASTRMERPVGADINMPGREVIQQRRERLRRAAQRREESRGST